MRYQIFFTQPGSSITTTCEVVIEILAHLRAINQQDKQRLLRGTKKPRESLKIPQIPHLQVSHSHV